jgi:hypothetical protein
MAFTARYAGTCKTCRGAIAQGEQIQGLKGGRRGYEHTDCTGATRELTYKERHGRCEDAPCCGCCDTFGSRYWSSSTLDALEAEELELESRAAAMPDFSHYGDNAAEAELAWIETRPWNNR